MRQAGGFPEVPVLQQPLGQLAKTDPEKLAGDLINIGSRLLHGLGQVIGLISGAAPEGHLTHVMEQGGNEYFFLMFGQYITGNVARLYRGMERARQQFLQLLTRHPRQQAIHQADRQADQSHILEAHQHNGARDGLDHFLGGVVVDAIGHPQHFGRQCRVVQQNIGHTLHRNAGGTAGSLLQVLDHRRQSRQFRLTQTLNPTCQTEGALAQDRNP